MQKFYISAISKTKQTKSVKYIILNKFRISLLPRKLNSIFNIFFLVESGSVWLTVLSAHFLTEKRKIIMEEGVLCFQIESEKNECHVFKRPCLLTSGLGSRRPFCIREQYQFFFSKTSQEGTSASSIASLISMIMSECYSPLAQFPPLSNAMLMGIKCNGYKKKHMNKRGARAETTTEKVLPLNTTKILWKLRRKRKQAWTSAKHCNDNAIRCQ